MGDGWYPGAVRKQITKWNQARTRGRGQVAHVAVSEADSLYGYFRNAQVCSHGYVRRGTPEQLAQGLPATIEQYVPIHFRAPANYEGNPTMVSFESQGGVRNSQTEQWDASQVLAIKLWTAWVASEDNSPLVNMNSSSRGARGCGTHRLGIDGNFDAAHPGRKQLGGGEKWSTSYGKLCPGNAKIDQYKGLVNELAGGAIPVSNAQPPAAPVGNGGSVKNWLQEGDSGAAVVELQNLLRAAGWSLAADGVFGPLTEAAVKQYQASRGLVVDGLAGAATLGALREGRPSIKLEPSTPVLQVGSRGGDVARLQRFLGILDDGIFGPATDSAVRQYQSGVGLTSDGVVGKLTWAKIDAGVRPAAPPASGMPTLRRGSSGNWVAQLQRRLNANYPSYSRLTIDGAFGPATEAVVKEFQRRSGLVADGIVGPMTRNALGF